MCSSPVLVFEDMVVAGVSDRDNPMETEESLDGATTPLNADPQGAYPVEGMAEIMKALAHMRGDYTCIRTRIARLLVHCSTHGDGAGQ